MLEMEKAWDKGISPNEFRKSRMDDLDFIFDIKTARKGMEKEMKKENERKRNVQNALNLLRGNQK